MLKNYFNFWGRTTASDYWWFAGPNLALVLLLILAPFINLFINIDPATFKPHDIQVAFPWQVFAYPLVVLLVPYLTGSIRRLRDSATSMLCMVVPLLGLSGWAIFLVVAGRQMNKPVNGPGEGLAMAGSLFLAGCYLVGAQAITAILLLVFFTGDSEMPVDQSQHGLDTHADVDDLWLRGGDDAATSPPTS